MIISCGREQGKGGKRRKLDKWENGEIIGG